MSIKLNHTIVHSRDKAASAAFFAQLLGLSEPKSFGPFLTVELDNDVTLDFIETDLDFVRTHYAFLVSEKEFDEIFGRIKESNLPYWADPMYHRANEINTRDGGRGCYFADPDGHNLEIITRPYGGGA